MCKVFVTTWPWCLFLSIHLMTCRHLTVFMSIHLMTCIFDSVSIHLMTYTFDSVCVDLSRDSTVTYYHWLYLSSHLTTCRHIRQMCSSHDLQMLLTVFVSIHLMTSDTFNSVCVHPSHDLRHFWQCLCPSISWPQTLLTVFVSFYLMTSDTFNSVRVYPSHDLRHFWQCLCPSSLWPADIFDSVFTSIHLMTFRHFLRRALLSPDNTTFSFSIFYKLFPGYNLILMPLFCISGTMTKTRSPHVVPKFDDASESSRALMDDKESKTAADQRARNKLTS